MTASKIVKRLTSYQPEVFEIIQAESARRRNGGKGFSLTLNQIVMEWLDAFNAGLVPVDMRGTLDISAVEKVLPVPTETEKK